MGRIDCDLFVDFTLRLARLCRHRRHLPAADVIDAGYRRPDITDDANQT